jgi:hypothetical protein
MYMGGQYIIPRSSGVRVGHGWAIAQGARYKGAPQAIKAPF